MQILLNISDVIETPKRFKIDMVLLVEKKSTKINLSISPNAFIYEALNTKKEIAAFMEMKQKTDHI